MRDYERIAAALADNSLLGRLDENAQRMLTAAGGPVELPPGSSLFRTGDPGDAAFVILEGELEVRRHSADGREVRIVALSAGAVVGEMAVFDGSPRSADVLATRRCRLWRIPRAALLRLLEQSPQAALTLLAELSRRIRQSNSDLEEARLLDLGGRLARLLLNEQSSRGVVALTQTEMARRLGYSREKVNRKLAAWTQAGWIELGRQGVRVLEPQRLREI